MLSATESFTLPTFCSNLLRQSKSPNGITSPRNFAVLSSDWRNGDNIGGDAGGRRGHRARGERARLLKRSLFAQCSGRRPPPLRRVIGRQNHKPTENPQRITDLVREPNRLGDSSAPLCDKFEGVSMNDAKAFPKPRLYSSSNTSTKIKCI